MTKFVNALVAGVFAAGLIGAPAAFAQTSDKATSTGGEKAIQDRSQSDAVRENQAAPTDAVTEGRKSMEDGSTGSMSNSTPKGGKPLGPTETKN